MLDPRTKLLLALGYGALIALTRRPLCLGVEWGLLVMVVLVSGKGKTYLRWLVMLLPMAFFFGGVTAWSAGMATGAVAATALLAMTTTFFLFFASTDPEDLGNSLVQAGLPFPIAFVTAAAMQFVPVVGRKLKAVIETQQARGIVLKPGVRALRNYPALLIPLLTQCFRMADDLAEAMESRGFGRPGRSFRTVYRMRLIDWLIVAGEWTAAALILLFIAR